MKSCIFFSLLGVLALAAVSAAAAPVEIKYSRQQLEEQWRGRVQSFLDRGVIPLIDLESSLKRGDGEDYLDDVLAVMDELGLALIAFDGYALAKRRTDRRKKARRKKTDRRGQDRRQSQQPPEGGERRTEESRRQEEARRQGEERRGQDEDRRDEKDRRQ